ncbi:MAG: hypothetical protein JWM56_636 [Candidatus Peribacteria bacterium]|nr:hypothetical protein [Candidatus Peribacteria bacterium]
MSPCDKFCPVNVTLDVIGGKWKLLILWYLQDETRRYSQLMRDIEGITPKMLAQQLRELERDGVVNRTVHPVVPPKVEYSLTPYGRTLNPIIESLGKWGSTHLERTNAAKEKQLVAL